jgi:hypothetical protein
MTTRSVYSVVWGKKPPYKIMLNGTKPVGTLDKLEHSGEWIAKVEKVEGIAWTEATALERAVRKLDPMAIVRLG